MTDRTSLEGRVAVVTGSAGGIGRAICALLAERGARVAGLDRVASDLPWLTLCCDMADDLAVSNAGARIRTELGDTDLVVHAAAIIEHATTLESSPAAFRRIFDVNVGGAVRLAQAFAPAMIARRRGAFLFVSSINARFATPTLSAYATSKGALDALTRTLALELAPHGIRVNGVAPASVDTPLLRDSFEREPDADAARAANVRRHPLGRLGQPEEIAELAAFLLSDAAGWMTGAVVPIDGGAGVTRS